MDISRVKFGDELTPSNIGGFEVGDIIQISEKYKKRLMVQIFQSDMMKKQIVLEHSVEKRFLIWVTIFVEHGSGRRS